MKTSLKYTIIALAVVLVISMLVCGGLTIPSAAKGVPPTETPSGPTNTPPPAGDYYVDCSAGTNGDGSLGSPWNNLDTVNSTTFAAGSSVLLKRGTTCAGTLWPKGSGSAGNPNIMDAYGTGAQPHVQATCADNGVYLFNQQYWEIRNLEVSNDCDKSSRSRRGIHIQVEDVGTATYYRILNNTVHDVAGDPNTDSPKSTGGIIFRVSGTTTETKFSDVVVEGNTVYTVDRQGYFMGASWYCRPEANCSYTNYYPWDAFIVRNNTLYDVGGDGLTIQNAWGSIVEYNVVHDAQARSRLCNAGIWPWNVENVTFQFNEAYNVRLTNTDCDGMGFDIDYATRNIIQQYSYSHDNEGGFMLVVGPTANGTVDAKVRYNISQNDKKHVFKIAGLAVTNAQLYNNTIYIPAGSTADVVAEGNWGGDVQSAYFWNNIFYNLGDGGYSFLNGNIQFDYNIFYGNHPATEPSDPHKITDDPLLVNPGSAGLGLGSVGGYQLQSGSPAIQAGRIVSDNGGRDYWGNPVPADSAPDIGAHQFSSGGPTPTPGPTATPAPPTDTPEPQPTDTPAPPTDTPEPGSAMHVGDITMSCGSLGVNHHALATVTILDAGDQPVGTATVYGQFTGATTNDVNGDTAGDGTVTLQSSNKKNGGTWTFTVDDVVKSGWTYDEGANVETSDSITCP